jgi:hypothetical protein
MIKQIIGMLNMLPHYGSTETIEIAKGKNMLPINFKSAFEQMKRQWKKRQ